MAEIVRWRTQRSKETVYRNRQGEPEVQVTERVRVSSIRSDRTDVSVIMDFAHALEVAGVTKGQVTAHRSDVGHLVQLVVEAEVTVPADDEQEARS